MFISNLISLLILFAVTCSVLGKDNRPFKIRNPDSSRALGFEYSAKSLFGFDCKRTYDKYLKATEGSPEGVHFQLKDCNEEGYCRLHIVDGDYKDYCLGGQPRPESQTCSTDNDIFRVNRDSTITLKDGKYLGIGDEYYDDCTNFQYAKFGNERYEWIIEYEKKAYTDCDDEVYHPKDSQRVFWST